MKLDKKQVPQLVVLFALVLGCVSFVSFQMIGSSPKHAAKKIRAASQTETADASRASASVTPDLEVQSVFPDLGTTLSRRDPFAPQPLPGARQPETVNTTAQEKSKPVSWRPASFARVPKIDVRPINPFAGSGDGARTAAPEVKPPDEPKFTLTGVVRGTQNVAIIRSAQGGRYVVRQGQMIDGRYRVLMVTGDGAVLAVGNRRIYVRLGGV